MITDTGITEAGLAYCTLLPYFILVKLVWLLNFTQSSSDLIFRYSSNKSRIVHRSYFSCTFQMSNRYTSISTSSDYTDGIKACVFLTVYTCKHNNDNVNEQFCICLHFTHVTTVTECWPFNFFHYAGYLHLVLSLNTSSVALELLLLLLLLFC